MKGWISLHRKILDNPILTRGRQYSRFEAFVYMLLKANHKKNKFQPMPASFGLVPELNNKIKEKKLRYKAYQERSLEVLHEFKKVLDKSFKKVHLSV